MKYDSEKEKKATTVAKRSGGICTGLFILASVSKMRRTISKTRSNKNIKAEEIRERKITDRIQDT